MSKKAIKTSHKQAKEDILKQREIAINLVRSGIETIKKHNKTPRSEVDNFKMKYQQWYGITYEILNEIFVSKDYSYKFRNQESSDTKYVSSDWQPDIEYYIRKEIKPKIDYLEILSDDIHMFDEFHDSDTNSETHVATNQNLDNITVKQLLDALKPSQLKAVIVIFLSIIIGVFYFGYEVNSWKVDKEKYNLTNENIKLKKETEILKRQLTTAKNKTDKPSERK